MPTDPLSAPCGCRECPRHLEERVERAEYQHYLDLRDEEIRTEVDDVESD